jgi:hypothetical protein
MSLSMGPTMSGHVGIMRNRQRTAESPQHGDNYGHSAHLGIGVPTPAALIRNHLEFAIIPFFRYLSYKGDIVLYRMQSIV